MEFKNAKGISQQIADNLSGQVASGHYAPGERIPSVRELAAEMGVNPNTIVRSYAELQTRGIIENQRGIGYFVTNNANDIIIEWKKKEFFEIDLPALAMQMIVLGITSDQLKPYLEKLLNNPDDENK